MLFRSQQNILAKSSPVYLPNNIFPKNIYTPASTLAQAAGNPTGLHVNKMGINPLAAQGLINENSYLNLTRTEYNTEATNRLTILYNTKIGSENPRNSDFVDFDVAKQFGITNNNLVIINSTLGLYDRKRAIDTTTNDLFFTQPNGINNGSLYFSSYTSFYLNNIATDGIVKAGSTLYTRINDFRRDVPQSTNFNSFLAKSNYVD